MSRLDLLRAAGVSVWLDDLSRELLESRRLADLVRDWGVTGATSNPTILARAITGSDRYDAQVRRAAATEVHDAERLFLQLALEDVRRAADLLRPTFDATGGRDGFVSLQCTPDLADDTWATVDQARELRRRLDRPNVLIKVAATEAGVRAVEELTADGVGVNVTLLFSGARYQQVLEAHLAGLERRLAAGLPLAGVASVASFFVSRVDTAVDALLPAGSALRGRTAVAGAALAFDTWLRCTSGPRWRRLAGRGARPQRLLWASTSTKDPDLPDLLYVESLVAPDTVTTVPEATLRAFAEHGRADRSLLSDTAGAQRVLRDLAAAGVDLPTVTAALERDGVASFRRSYQQLLTRLEVRARAA